MSAEGCLFFGNVRILVELSATLAESGVRLVLAHDVGEVRDVLDHEPGTTSIPVYRTVAVDAVRR